MAILAELRVDRVQIVVALLGGEEGGSGVERWMVSRLSPCSAGYAESAVGRECVNQGRVFHNVCSH